MEPFKEIIPCLKESRISKSLTEKHKFYESHVRMFWKSVRYDEQEKTIYTAIRMKDKENKDIDVEVKFTVADVRRVLDLKDNDDNPIIIPERLSKRFWYRMGYVGHVNDKCYVKSRFCRPYKFMVQCVAHALSHRKGAYDETSDYIMKIITCLVLYRPYNISHVLFNHMVDNVKGEKYIMYPIFIQMLLDDLVPNLPKDPVDELKLLHMSSETLNRLNKYKGLTGDQEPRVKRMIAKPNYEAPENDHWRYEESISEDESERFWGMVGKRLKFWYEKDEKKRKRTPKISPKVVTPKSVIKGKIGKQELQKRLVDYSFEYYSNVVNVCIEEPAKKKSPPKLVDEPMIDPTELIKQGADLLNMSFDQYIKHTADEAAAKAQGSNVEKEAETSTKNVEVECVKEKEVEGVVHTDSSATESDIDPTMIAPTSYISGKQKLKTSPKKKKDSNEEDSTYIPTLDEKKKLRRKRKAHPTDVIPRSVRARKGATTVPEVQSVQMPEVQSVKAPEVERHDETTKGPEVEKVQSVEKPEVESKKAPKRLEYERVEKIVQEEEVEFMGERQSTPPPPPPINPTIHIHDDPKDTSQQKKDTTLSSSHRFLRVQGEYPDDLPEGGFDIFNERKINVLTKKVSLLEKAKAKAETQRDELKEKLKAMKAENAELKKAVEDHAERIDQLNDDLEDHAKVIDRITEEFDEVNEKYETMNETNNKLHQMIGELHETSSNENKVLRQETEALRADKAVKDE
ncbi:putative transcription factor bZIP family [Helianthus debilis subsp. tardiflorus]